MCLCITPPGIPKCSLPPWWQFIENGQMLFFVGYRPSLRKELQREVDRAIKQYQSSAKGGNQSPAKKTK